MVPNGFTNSPTNSAPPLIKDIKRPNITPRAIPIRIFQCKANFFIDYIYDYILENESHWIHKVFVEMQKINETETLEEELEDCEERIAFAEYRNDEICPYIQKIIWRFIKEDM